jgi:hypothetical protein
MNSTIASMNINHHTNISTYSTLTTGIPNINIHSKPKQVINIDTVTVFILFPYSYGLVVGSQPIFSLIHYAYLFLWLHATFVDNYLLFREQLLPVTPASLSSNPLS